LKISNWSSTSTTLKKGEKKDDFDEYPVLERFKIQLDNSNIVTKYTLNLIYLGHAKMWIK
jgi:hypothetical protein